MASDGYKNDVNDNEVVDNKEVVMTMRRRRRRRRRS